MLAAASSGRGGGAARLQSSAQKASAYLAQHRIVVRDVHGQSDGGIFVDDVISAELDRRSPRANAAGKGIAGVSSRDQRAKRRHEDALAREEEYKLSSSDSSDTEDTPMPGKRSGKGPARKRARRSGM